MCIQYGRDDEEFMVSNAEESSEIEEATSRSALKYVFVTIGNNISVLGSDITSFAFFIWFVSAASGTSFENTEGLIYGLAIALYLTPQILTSFFGGPFIDKGNRKNIIMFVDTIAALSSLAVGLVFQFNLFNSYFFLLLVIYSNITIVSAMNGIQRTADSTLVQIMVPEKQRSLFNSMSGILINISLLAGPIFGALAVGLLGLENIQYIIYIDVFTFFVSVTLTSILLSIPKKQEIREMTEEEEEEEESYFQSLSTGIKFLRRNRAFLIFQMNLVAVNVIFIALFTLPLIILQHPQLFNIRNTSDIANALAAFQLVYQVGAIAGIGVFVLAGLLAKRRGEKPIFDEITGAKVGIASMYATAFVLTLGSTLVSPLLFMSGALLFGFANNVMITRAVNMWQASVPNHMFGRIYSVRFLLASSLNPLIALTVGYLSDMVRPDYILYFLIAMTSILFVVTWLIPGEKIDQGFKKENIQVHLH